MVKWILLYCIGGFIINLLTTILVLSHLAKLCEGRPHIYQRLVDEYLSMRIKIPLLRINNQTIVTIINFIATLIIWPINVIRYLYLGYLACQMAKLTKLTK